MSDTTYVPLKNDLLMKLIARYKEDYSSAIDDVIEDFLERTSDQDQTLLGQRNDGYIWDQLTLPAGTELRTRYYDQWQVAILKNGQFSHNNQLFKSPAKVCNAMRGNTSTNAWHMLQVKRPQDIDFKKAEKFRL